MESAAGEVVPPSNPLTGPTAPVRPVCAPDRCPPIVSRTNPHREETSHDDPFLDPQPVHTFAPPLRTSPAWCRQSLEALEDRTLLSVNFAPAVNFAAGGHVSSVAVGDFNHDGQPDLVTANSDSLTVSVLLGTGTGSFSPAVQYAVGAVGSPPNSVAVGDFNGDGVEDLVTSDADLSDNSVNVSVLLGNGDGTFQNAVNYAAGFGPHAVAVGDFNGDD